MMNIKHNPQFNIEKVTAHYSKKDGVPIHYVCTSDLDKSDVPVDIYYRDSPHPDYNNYYFGLYTDEEDRMMIFVGILWYARNVDPRFPNL